MSYSKAQIANLCTLVTSGGTPLTSVPAYYDPKEVPWLKTGEVNYCRIYDTENYISKEGLARSSAKMIPANSVVVAMYGQGDTAGRVAINKIPLSTNQACCNLVINHVIADYEYVYYALCTLYDRLVALKNGGAQPNLNAKKIKAIEIPFPDLETQRTIASVLGAYDNLIENNQKQIKLLEEAAQRLYKEWFVDLRFPGYEDTPIVDGVPEGWEVCKFSEIASIMSGGTPKTEVKEYYEGDIPFYTPKDSDGSFFVFDTITHISEAGLEHCNSQYYPEGTVIITARGTVGKTTILAVPMAMNQSCYALKCDELNSPYYLFFSLNKEVDSLKTMANGGVFNTIIVKTFDSISLTIPTQKVLSAFNAVVSSIMQQIKAKMKQNIHLAEARNRLLPKLMSGEIEV